MRPRIALMVTVALGLLLAACSLSQIGVGSKQSAATSGQGGASSSGSAAGGSLSGTLSITNDPSRGVALYTGPSGSSEEVTAVDPSDGVQVACTTATSYAVIQPGDAGESLPPGVLVVGDRSDGSPGVWEIDSKGTITLVEKEEGGRAGDLSPRRDEAPEGLHRHLGWSFHVTAISSDGKMIVGYAENARGIHRGPLAIPAGTTVGIYWRVRLGPHGRHSVVSPPNVIGTWQAPQGHGRHARADHDIPFGFLSALKLFFVGRLQSYLIMATAVRFDSAQSAYVITGTDQDGTPATATISKDNAISIQEIQSPPTTTYSQIIIDTYNPTGIGSGAGFDVVGLFSASGVTSSANPWTSPATGTLAVDGETGYGSNPNSSQPGFAYIDYTPSTPLPSGTVLYVRISGYDFDSTDTTGSSASVGAYAIRVLTSPSSSYTYFSGTNPSDSPYEAGDTPLSGGVPTNAASITVNDPQGQNRYIGTGQVDWVKITLP